MANTGGNEKKGPWFKWIFLCALSVIMAVLVVLPAIHGTMAKRKYEFLEKNRVVDLGYILPLTGRECELKPGMVGFTVKDSAGNVSYLEVKVRDVSYINDLGRCRVRLESDQYSRSLYDGRVTGPLEYIRKTRIPGKFYIIGHDYEKYIKKDETR